MLLLVISWLYDVESKILYAVIFFFHIILLSNAICHIFMVLEPNQTPLSSLMDDPKIPTTSASSRPLILINLFENNQHLTFINVVN